MNQTELQDLEIVLSRYFGDFARWQLHDRELKSPMNFVLDTAEQDLKRPFTVVWVDNATPETFSFPQGFSEPVAIFNSRLAELWGNVRATFIDTIFEASLKKQIVERLCLQLMAERSLSKHNDPESAISWILRASTILPSVVILPNTIASMELERISPAYMACWFYALAHELGHFVAKHQLYSKETMIEIIKMALDQFPVIPEEIRTEALNHAVNGEAGFVLDIDALREEGAADIFASSILLQSTYRIMNEITRAEDRFEVLAFVGEMFISVNVLATINRCERLCDLASARRPKSEMAIELLLHPVHLTVRGLQVRHYLEEATLSFVYGDDRSDADRETISGAIDEIVDHLKPNVDAMETGMAAAIEFAAIRVNRPGFLKVVEKWNEAEKNPAIVFDFLNLARSRGKWASHFDVVVAKLNDPDAPLEMKVNATVYFCPMILGPDDFNRPFTLMTRYGNLVFAFLSESDLCKLFCELSCEGLAEGFRVSPVPAIAESLPRLELAIGQRLEPGVDFILAVEGTEFFNSGMTQLSDGTIFDIDTAGSE